MNILVVNDDSINSPFLKEITRLLKSENHEVMVVAPKVQQSAKSHGLTLGAPMKLEKHPDIVEGVKTYSLDATPATCTKFAFVHLDYDFDLVSGRYVIDAKSIMGIFSLDLSKSIDLAIHTDENLDNIMEVLKPYLVE